MPKKYTLAAFSAAIIGLGTLLFCLSQNQTIAVLDPKGNIADQQKSLIAIAVLLSLLVIVPVYVLTIYIAWKYRAGNKKARYTPEWDHSRILEAAWWGIPCVIILILSVTTWQSSHRLDPFKPIAGGYKPVTIQVVALQWKWLFIYPEQQIATVNYIRFPEKTPINFHITADAPMNSFWIPQLGGQVYAMSGMTTKLHLLANQAGTFEGSSANLSGTGFSGMRFTAQSTSQDSFYDWVQAAKNAGNTLDYPAYTELSKPSRDTPRIEYSTVDPKLFTSIIDKYMAPSHATAKPDNAQNPNSQNNKQEEPHAHSH